VYAAVTADMNCVAVVPATVVFKAVAAAAVATETLASILTYDVVKRRNAVEDKRRALVATLKFTDTAETCTLKLEAMPAAITGLCVAAAVTKAAGSVTSILISNLTLCPDALEFVEFVELLVEFEVALEVLVDGPLLAVKNLRADDPSSSSSPASSLRARNTSPKSKGRSLSSQLLATDPSELDEKTPTLSN